MTDVNENNTNPENTQTGLEIAIIGMAGRFPGANNVEQFWENIKNGIESIGFYSDEELLESGMGPEMLDNPNFVKAKGQIDGIDYFDAHFFDYSPQDAADMDPQSRIFHECAWEALEDAGYNPGEYDGLIGVYAGSSINTEWMKPFFTPGNDSRRDTMILKLNEYLSPSISYKLNLKGPSITVSTACSTSLVAVHLACRGLLNGECNMALAGSATVRLPKVSGYVYREGMVFSPDGHCRAFDADAGGTMFSNGAGVVILKTLEDAVEDGDTVYAVIKGSAVNNDGAQKIGFTAPAINGQADVIKAAHYASEIEPTSLSYLETHGTGTPVGDSIEMEAIIRAFNTTEKGFCKIGAVKTNVGHTETAAGVTGLIKTALSLKHKIIPPTLHFMSPDPESDIQNSPFSVNTALTPWVTNRLPRRAGVNSFGIGGTNVHVVLEEWSEPKNQEEGRKYQLISLSAKTSEALDRMTGNLARNIEQNREKPVNLSNYFSLPDAAYTLHVGRQDFPLRRTVVCSGASDVLDALSDLEKKKTSPASRKIHTFNAGEKEKKAIFMFAGLEAQYIDMGRELYYEETDFREEMDRCFELLRPLMEYDPKDLLYNRSNRSNKSHKTGKSHSEELYRTEIAQPVVFIIEYALARLLMKWGIQPKAMIGYSFGEYTAACIAEVISLEDALKLVTARGRLMAQTPEGAMLSVPLPAAELTPLLPSDLSIAIDNGVSCVAAGPVEAVDNFEKQMKERRLLCMRLESNRAVHSTLMEPIVAPFEEEVKKITLNKPRIPFISNVTGNWITPEEAVDPAYWGRHLRETVRFSKGLNLLLEQENVVFLEVGPGRALSTQLRQQAGKESGHLTVTLLRHPEEPLSDVRFLLEQIGRLWLYGVKINWDGFYRFEKKSRTRIPLPPYPFQRQFYKTSIPSSTAPSEPSSGTPGQLDISKWFYMPSWKPAALPDKSAAPPKKDPEKIPTKILLFVDDSGLGLHLAKQLEENGFHVTSVKTGPAFGNNDASYTVNPKEPDHYEKLFKDLRRTERVPGKILHLWGITGKNEDAIDDTLDLGFYSLLYLAGAIGNQHLLADITLLAVTDNMQDVTGDEVLSPAKAAVPAAGKIISQEYLNINFRSIDILLPAPESRKRKKLVDRLSGELTAETSDLDVVYRGNFRWVQVYEPLSMPAPTAGNSRLKEKGVYLVTGGLGGVGYVLAKHLAERYNARLILTGRAPIPAKAQREEWLSTHPGENPVSLKIKKIQALEESGAEILALAADAADEGQMREAVSLGEEAFGPLNGVFHTAGVPREESGLPISGIDRDRCRSIFLPKIQGTLILEKVLREKKLDFCLLMSSISSVLGGLGHAAYAAAHIFMDAFTRLQNRENPVPWFSVDWDGWRTEPDAKPREFSASSWEEFAMTPTQGIECVERVLSLEEGSHLVHSTGDLNARIREWLSPESLHRSGRSSSREDGENAAIYTRPLLSNPYIAPQTKIERLISEVWQDFLGIDQVGVNDNLFDLKVTSLDMVRVNNTLRNILKKDIPVVAMFNYPTIRSLSLYLSREADAGEGPDRSEALKTGQSRVKNIRNRNIRTKNG